MLLMVLVLRCSGQSVIVVYRYFPRSILLQTAGAVLPPEGANLHSGKTNHAAAPIYAASFCLVGEDAPYLPAYRTTSVAIYLTSPQEF